MSAALAAPAVALLLVHLLQRLEVWALEDVRNGDVPPRTRSALRTAPCSPPLRQSQVSPRRREGEASDHG